MSMSTRKTQWLANCWPDPLRHEVARAYEQLSETAEFRLILEDLARYGGLRTTSFVPGQSDQTAFNEGQRDLVFHLLEMASLDLCIQPKVAAQAQENHSIQHEED